MAETGEDHVLQLVHLLHESGVDARVRMAEQVHPPGADGVQIAAPIEVLQPYPLAAADGHRRQGLVVLHLRAGVPQDREVAAYEGVVTAHAGSDVTQNRCMKCSSNLSMGSTLAMGSDSLGW